MNNILVVEDNEGNRKLLETVLAYWGHTVTAVDETSPPWLKKFFKRFKQSN